MRIGKELIQEGSKIHVENGRIIVGTIEEEENKWRIIGVYNRGEI